MSWFYLMIIRLLSRGFVVVFGLLLFIIVIIQVKMLFPKNPNSSSSYFINDNNRQESQKYRRKLNLMDEGSKPVKDCTLGRLYTSFLHKLFNSFIHFLYLKKRIHKRSQISSRSSMCYRDH